MDRAQIIAHTKMYMDLLVQGIDPISKEKITGDSVVNQERMRKCFAFVSEILGELMDNNGFVAMTESDRERYKVVVSKAAFSLSEDQLHRIKVSSSPVSQNDFLKRVNRVVDANRMEKLSAKSMNAWLVAKGYVVESKEQAVINRTVRRPSEKSGQIGLCEHEVIDPKTGEIKTQIMFSLQAQAYLLEHIEEIARLK